MTDQSQPEQKDPEEDLASEFRILGQTLMEAIRTAWENPERKRMQQDIESGLNEFGATLRQEGETFRDSPTGQRLKSEIDELQERIRSGEAEQRLRQDLLNALKSINAELKKATERWSGEKDQASSSADRRTEPPGGEA
jgi:hypothetical protein